MPNLRTPLSTPGRRIRRAGHGSVAVVMAAVFAVAGCANDVRAVATGGPSTALADGGWIGGSPPVRETGGDADAYEAGYGTDSGAAAVSDSATMSEKSASVSTISDGVAPPSGQSPLHAGNVDDNAAFDGFLAYLARVAESGVPFRALDPTGRIVIAVRDADGRPVSGALVVVGSGDREVASLRTTADGTTRFHPRAGNAGDGPFTVRVGSASVEAAPGESVELQTEAGPAVERVPLDIAFAIDLTGSMGDELDRLKVSVASVVERIEALPGAPDVRLAMTVFRDEGDSFVTATHDFTSDVGEFRSALSDLEAGGGGDTPEALDEALGEVLTKPAWRRAGEATQLVFVVGDAGGHPERDLDRPYTESMQDAASRGIKIIPIAASSTDDQAEVAFRQMAQFTGARFVFLAYGAGGAATGGSTDIATTDYEELSLDDLIVRLVADELAARSGVDVTVPTNPTTTTRPPGQ